MIEHEFTDDIVCPYCGDKVDEPHELDDEGELECNCGNTYDYCRNIRITYSTSKAECAKGKHDWKLENYMKCESIPVYNRASNSVSFIKLGEGKAEYFRVSKCSICDKPDIQEVIKEEYDLAPQEIKI